MRLTHWFLALLVFVSWLTAEYAWSYWHKLSGYTVFGLVLFRLYWGFCGSEPARFGHFLCGPRAVLRHVRAFFADRQRTVTLGHNPLGGWNVIAMLAVLGAQGGLGLFAVDAYGIESGPLAAYVGFETGRRMAALHETTFNLLLLLIALHVAAILIHFFVKRENLITPMLTGCKTVPWGEACALRFAPPWRAFLGIALAALLVMGIVIAL